MKVTIGEEWVVEGQYSASIGWEALTYCESEAEADEMVACYREAEPSTPIRRRVIRS
jgi:hypothetical protein